MVICSLLRNHLANLDLGSIWKPLEDSIFGIHLRQVWAKFPGPTLSVSLPTAIPTDKNVGMTTIGTVGTVGIVGSHSFFPFKTLFSMPIYSADPVPNREKLFSLFFPCYRDFFFRA